MLASSTGKPVRTTYRNRLQFPNGWSVSWVAALTKLNGPAGVYCEPLTQDNRNASDHSLHQATFAKVEVAIFNPQEDLVEFQSGDTVKGYCSPTELLEILNWAAAQKGS